MIHTLKSQTANNSHEIENYRWEGINDFLKNNPENGRNGLPLNSILLSIDDYQNMLEALGAETVHDLITGNNIRELISQVREFIQARYKISHAKVTHIGIQDSSDIITNKTKSLLILCSYLKAQLQANNIISTTQDSVNDILFTQEKMAA